MFKKIEIWIVILLILLSLVGALAFGSLVKYYYDGGKRFKPLTKTAIFIASIPINFTKMVRSGSLNVGTPSKLIKHKDKKRFERFIENQRNILLVLPRYDHSSNRSEVNIIDLSSFKVIHTYKHDILEMYNQVQNIEDFPKLRIDDSPIRFEYRHPLILNDGSLISDSEYSIEFKIDFCSNLKWINDEETFHHSKMLDHDNNILSVARLNSPSKYIDKYKIKNFYDDAIIKMNKDGKILYKKSIIEILIENKIFPNNYAYNSSLYGTHDPIHLNDIEPVLKDTDYWKKGDLFLSSRHLSAIIHYRPSDNKVINYITGPFFEQHDVDIISDKEISIFNNNNFVINNEHSEILIYNFETKEFKRLFESQLKKENFKTITQGLSHILEDGSLIVEEQNHGRIIMFNNKGEKEWEFVNKDKNGDIGFVSWSRIIEDEELIYKIKDDIKNKKCLN